MTSLSDVFAEKERTNWLKAWLAVDIAKSGLEQFVENEAKTVHTNIYNTVWSSSQTPAACIGCHTANLLKCPTQGVCMKRGAQGYCKSMHAVKQPRPCPANVCNKVHDEIVKQHTFNNPSWKNTSAQQWAKNTWEIAKAFFPPDGYVGKTSVQDTDFNGLISFMMNCKHFNNKFSFTIGKHGTPCLLTKARESGKTVRHSSQCKLTDPDLQDIFTTLISLLSDPTCLANDVNAREAVRKLAELEKDALKITTEEMIHLLVAAQDTLQKVEDIADKSLDDMKKYLEQCKKDINTHVDKCKQDLDDHTAQCTSTIYERVSKTVESTYTKSRDELIDGMKKLYKDKLNHVTISPFNDNVDAKLRAVYRPPKMSKMCIDKTEFKKTGRRILKYKDVFLTDGKVNRRIFLQGEAGSGKTTFLAKLTLDWCEHPFVNLDSTNKTDSKTCQLVIYDRTKFSTSSVNAEQSVMTSAPSATTEESHVSYPCHVEPSDTDLETNELVIDDCTKSSTSSVNSEESDMFSASSASSDEYMFCKWDSSAELFADLDVLQSYVFVFHITLRYSVKQLDVTTMIKEQLIDSIYYSQEDRKKAYRLLNEIMKHERFLVLLDGLDEWTGPEDQNSLPTLVALHSQCEVLITTRPWKLAVGKIRHSEIDALLQLEGINEPFELSRSILSRLVDKEELTNKYSAFTHYIEKHNLGKILSSPIMINAIVCSYAEGKELKGSKCEIYIHLLESLFKKANSETSEFQQLPFPCFKGTQYIQPNMEHVNRLAEMAFHLLFINPKETSVVFSNAVLKQFMMDGREQKDFAFKSGILSAKRNACILRSESSFMFIHMSMQEFLAAYHMARNNIVIGRDISVYLNRHEDAYREIAQVFTFLCGLDISGAETLSNMMDEHDALKQGDPDNMETFRQISFQNIILTGYREAIANGNIDISLKLSRFEFNGYDPDLHRILTKNTANVSSLDFRNKKTLENRQDSAAINVSASHIEFDLTSCRRLKRLDLSGCDIFLTDNASSTTSQVPVWFIINNADPTQCRDPPLALLSIEHVSLYQKVTCSSSLLRNLLSMQHDHYFYFWSNDCYISTPGCSTDIKLIHWHEIFTEYSNTDTLLSINLDDDTCLWEVLRGLHIKSLRLFGCLGGFRVNHKDSFCKTLSSLTHLENLRISNCVGSTGLLEALHGLNIKSLDLHVVKGDLLKESFAQALSSLAKLETITIHEDVDCTGLVEAFRGLKINIKSLNLNLKRSLRGVVDGSHAESLAQSLSSLTQLETLIIDVHGDGPGLLEALHGLNINIKSLNLCLCPNAHRHSKMGVLNSKSLSQSLSSLKQLQTLSFTVKGDFPGLWEAMNDLNIKSLNLCLCPRLSPSWIDPNAHSDMGALDSESLKHSLSSLKQLETLSIEMNGRFPGLWEAMNGLNIKSLKLCLNPRLSPSLSKLSPLSVSDEILKLEPAQLLCQSLLSLRQLESLIISVDAYHPGSLWEALKGLNIKSLSLSLSDQCFSWRGLCAKSLHQSLLSLSQLENLSIDVNRNNPVSGLWEALIDLNIKSLSLSLSGVRNGLHEESLSQSLSSLKRLEMLTLHVYTYIDIQLPKSLKFFNFYCDALIPSKLRDLVEKLAACTHTIEFKLDFVCAAGVYPTEHDPLQGYSQIQQELRARKNIAVKRFRMYERICKSNTYEGFYNAESSTYERDAGDVNDDDHDDHSVNDDAYKSFSKWMTDRNVNRISIRL